MSSGVTFCFIVIKDLIKEHVWTKWFDELRARNFPFTVLTHCSRPEAISSPWLKSTLIPAEYTKPTSWERHTTAVLSLHKYALETTNSDWYTLHSESCVPFVNVDTFIETYTKYRSNTFLSYSKIWWDPLVSNRANLYMIPEEHRYAHQEWCILCREDAEQIMQISKVRANVTEIMTSGVCADESLIGVFISMINNFKNVVNKKTTAVDWTRSTNSSCSPHMFNEWTEKDVEIIDGLKADNMIMFLRKIGPSFPDDVLFNFIKS